MFTWAKGKLTRVKSRPVGRWTKFHNDALGDDVWVAEGQEAAYQEIANSLIAPPLPPPRSKAKKNIPPPQLEIQEVSPSRELQVAKIETPPQKPAFDLALVPNDILLHVLMYLDEAELAKLRQVAKRFKRLAQMAISRFIVRHTTGFSSVIGSLEEYMKAEIGNSQDLLLSVDQITDDGFMMSILGEDIDSQINMGRQSRSRWENSTDLNVRVTTPKVGKMHNKFWVLDNSVVITGSPNLTYSAFNFNIESIVRLESKYVAACFRLYFEIMRSPSRSQKKLDKEEQLIGMLNALNCSNSSFRLALSPYTDIQDFVVDTCQGATEIVIRMFLVSYFDGGGDIVEELGKLAKGGTKITLFVDANQYHETCDESGYYVQTAVQKLKRYGIKVYTQARTNGKIMHDKLILIKFGDERGHSYRTLIGSAGFSQNVMNNNNFENMVSIDGFFLYNFFMTQHHLVTLKRKGDYRTVQV